MGQRLQFVRWRMAKAVGPSWRKFVVVALGLILGAGACSKLVGGPFDKVFVVDNGSVDGGLAGSSATSCISRAAECGEFFDEVLGVTFQCGGCASNERCVTNQCVCDTVSCEELGTECGFQNNGCNQLTSCGKCEDLYPADPDKAYCDAEGKCGKAPVLPTTCEEVRALGQAADCGIVGIGETTLDCGVCPGREQCVNNRCEGYEPLTCDDLTGGGLLCGTFPNGAGGEITCACGPNERCASGNVCCSPRTVCPADGCGVIPDGCGGTIDCGGCSDGETCQGNVCCGGTPQCPEGVCGPQVMVCGQALQCDCSAGACCIDDGDGAGTCRTPACPTDGRCGDGLDDGCGGTVDGCGCPDSHVCNALGMCECVPRTCPVDGSECGLLDDGCGGEINCFKCPETNEQTCYEGACCEPSCPSDGSCGLVSNGCGGQKTCECGEGEACIDGKCATPECPTGADCGVNLVAGVALSCRGQCGDGQTCAERMDGVYACGDCSATCPTDAVCGLVDLGCTILSCEGSCVLDSQSCVNRKVGGGLDNFACCTPSCPNVAEATCGDNVDPLCGGQTVSCSGACPSGQRCVLGEDDKYGCVVPQCPEDPTCGENAAVPEGTIQCEGSCPNPNEQCIDNGTTYACICQALPDPCGTSCDTSASNGCGRDVPCTCPANEQCLDGSCCRPDADRVVCEEANAECGSVVEPRCLTDVACGLCAGDQTCVNNQCACDPSRCEANESCDAATQTCKCDSTKCPSGQSCTTQGTCTCDSSKCPDDKVCNAQGMCACPQTVQQACGGATCGTAVNDCGETVNCGSCPANRSCDDGVCVCNESNAQACTGLACGTTANDCQEQVSCPNTCDAVTEQCSGNQCACRETATVACQRLGFECGPATNNCGGPITCPNSCSNNEQCTGNTCVCNETPAEACERQNLCGDVTGMSKQDQCGGALTDCGACADDYECSNNLCVCAETAAQACDRLNLCGSVVGQNHTDACGQPLTDCGMCGANEQCTNNQCVCVETACEGKVCGTFTSVCTNQPISCGPCDGTCASDGGACVPEAVVDAGP